MFTLTFKRREVLPCAGGTLSPSEGGGGGGVIPVFLPVLAEKLRPEVFAGMIMVHYVFG